MNNVTWWFWGAGRTSRRPYWLALAVVFAAGWLVDAVARTIAAAYAPLMGYAGVALLLGGGVNAWVSTCLVTRRLHDIGRSGWWQLTPLVFIVPGLAAAEPAWAASLGLGEAGSVLGFLVALGTYLDFLAVLGPPGWPPKPPGPWPPPQGPPPPP